MWCQIVLRHVDVLAVGVFLACPDHIITYIIYCICIIYVYDEWLILSQCLGRFVLDVAVVSRSGVAFRGVLAALY